MVQEMPLKEQGNYESFPRCLTSARAKELAHCKRGLTVDNGRPCGASSFPRAAALLQFSMTKNKSARGWPLQKLQHSLWRDPKRFRDLMRCANSTVTSNLFSDVCSCYMDPDALSMDIPLHEDRLQAYELHPSRNLLVVVLSKSRL